MLLVEIRGISFDKYMELCDALPFSPSLLRGVRRYLAQPIYQGGIGFAVYRPEYFPSEKMRGFANIFDSEDDMIGNIVPRIRLLEKDNALYRKTNRSMMGIYDFLYSKADYLKRIEKLLKREFEIYPYRAT